MFDRRYAAGVAAALQGSLFDQAEVIGLRSLASLRRTPLDDTAWIDLLPGWLAGADALFERLVAGVPWRAERRRMYDRVVSVPRLVSFYDEDEPLPDPILSQARAALCDHYGAELGEPFRTAGLCYYRDGRDSVAWHGDTIGRGSTEDTMVAILSVGAPRALLLRPRGGGRSEARFAARPVARAGARAYARPWPRTAMCTRRAWVDGATRDDFG